MIAPIAEMLRVIIEPLNFVDRISGLVKPTKVVLKNEEETAVKVVPMAINDFGIDCDPGDLMPMLPDGQYKSVHFFEDGGIEFVEGGEESRYYYCEATLRLVSWYNLKQINQAFTDCNLLTANILAIVPFRLANSGYYTQITVEPTVEETKGASVFDAYDLNDAEKQFATYPYECTAISFNVGFAIPINCVVPIVLNPAEC